MVVFRSRFASGRIIRAIRRRIDSGAYEIDSDGNVSFSKVLRLHCTNKHALRFRSVQLQLMLKGYTYTIPLYFVRRWQVRRLYRAAYILWSERNLHEANFLGKDSDPAPH